MTPRLPSPSSELRLRFDFPYDTKLYILFNHAAAPEPLTSAFDNTSMSKPPADMVPELAEWNNGKGIDLESWIACSGDFRMAIGYSTVFWPRFVLFEDYILREGFTPESVRGFEEQQKCDKRSIEAVVNHLHIADIQHHGCEDITEQRVVFLGRILKEIYEAKLAWQFPERPCEVSFYEPEDRTDLIAFQITFWQQKHVEACGTPHDAPASSIGNPKVTEGPSSVT